MAKLVTLRHRIASVTGTRQITKAMQLVSASKLKRAQAQAVASRDYRAVAYELLSRLSASREIMDGPLFARRPVKTKLYVIMTSNSGLAGAYNANVLKRLIALSREDQARQVVSQVIAVGTKGAQLVRHLAGVDMIAYYPFFGNHPTQNDVQPLLRSIVDGYSERKTDEVHVLYTFAPSRIKQEVVDLKLLPAETPIADDSPAAHVMNFEPSAEVVVDHVATRLIEVQLWQAVLESLASEHLSRMLAMKSATDNATDLIADYTLTYQTERQAAITQELAEITGGAEAVRD